MKRTRFYRLMGLALILFTTSILSAQETNSHEQLKGREFSMEHGILSKMPRLENQNKKSETTPFYQNPLISKRMGLKSQTNSKNKPNNIGYGFHGHVYGGMNVSFASITDGNGNFYITGGSTNINQPEGNFTTIKIDATGNMLWEARETGTQYAVEYGMVIGLDNSGNPIAAGVHWNGTDMDLRTVKYDPVTGNVLWRATYNNSQAEDGLDAPAALTTDSNGNIYIAGITYTGTNIAFLTLKYDSSGNLLWSVTDNNPLPDSWNEPSAIITDANGNVLVTGYAGNSNYYAGYYTIKYDSNGTKLWSQLHNYQPNGVDTNSFAKDIDFDANGNYYVTGIYGDELSGTIKYDSAGNELWVKTYQTGTDLTRGFDVEVVSSNEIYVAGTHYGTFSNDGLVLLSYKDDGTQNWVQETNDLIGIRTGHFDLDSNNQPVIAGFGKDPNNSDQWIRIYKYDNTGSLDADTEYLKTYSPMVGIQGFTGMGLNDDQSVYFAMDVFYTAEGGVFEYGKLSFDPAETSPIWTGTFENDGTTRSSMLHSITDDSNNTYTTSSFGAYENGNYVTKLSVIKYDDQGDVAWEKIYNPEANGFGTTGIMVDVNTTGDVVVFLSPGVFETDPLRLKKYDSQGNLLWQTQKTVHSAALYVLLTDDSGNIYIGGSSRENTTDPATQFTLIKFSPTGTELWASFDDSGVAGDNIFAINAGEINSAGEIILTGASGVGTMFSEDVDLAVLKYDGNGTLLSFDSFPQTGKNSSGTDLLIDQNDNIYINGLTQDKSTYAEEMLLLKLDSQNAQQWISFYGETGRNVRSYTIDQYSTGELLVSGRSYVVGLDNKMVLVKFDTNGNQVWVKNSSLDRFYKDMYLDDLDKAHVLYQVLTTTYPHRLFYSAGALPRAGLWKVDSGGSPQSEEVFTGAELSQFFAKVLVPLQNNTLLIGGDLSNEAAFYEGLYFFESTHGVLGIDENEFQTSENNWLGQNYPNPVNTVTTIPFFLKNGGEVNIGVYTMMGRKVMSLSKQNFSAGPNKIEVDLSQLSPGVYIYRVGANGMEGSQKLIVK